MFSDLIGKSFEEMNCFDVVKKVYKMFGINIPDYNFACDIVKHSNYDQTLLQDNIKHYKSEWQLIAKPEKPCLILMSLDIPGILHHFGVYVGNDRFIHSNKTAGVCMPRLNSVLYKNRRMEFYRYVG